MGWHVGRINSSLELLKCMGCICFRSGFIDFYFITFCRKCYKLPWIIFAWKAVNKHTEIFRSLEVPIAAFISAAATGTQPRALSHPLSTGAATCSLLPPAATKSQTRLESKSIQKVARGIWGRKYVIWESIHSRTGRKKRNLTLQAECFQPEFHAIKDDKAVRRLWSKRRILLISVKVSGVSSQTNLLDFTNINCTGKGGGGSQNETEDRKQGPLQKLTASVVLLIETWIGTAIMLAKGTELHFGIAISQYGLVFSCCRQSSGDDYIFTRPDETMCTKHKGHYIINYFLPCGTLSSAPESLH